MKSIIPADLTFCEVGHLPIIKAFAQKIKLVETLDTMVGSQMELSPGTCVLAMVLTHYPAEHPYIALNASSKKKTPSCCWAKRSSPVLSLTTTWLG
jgi:hypothetical protein